MLPEMEKQGTEKKTRRLKIETKLTEVNCAQWQIAK